jgi:hypothetical protein
MGLYFVSLSITEIFFSEYKNAKSVAFLEIDWSSGSFFLNGRVLIQQNIVLYLSKKVSNFLDEMPFH